MTVLETKIPDFVQFGTSKDQKIFHGKPFPLIITPTSTCSLEAFHEWMSSSCAHINELLRTHGALLLRGFPLSTPDHFQTTLDTLKMDPLPYIGGAAPRHAVIANVVTTNEAPPEALIPFHHEMAQVPLHPSKVFFFCQTSPEAGGETPVCLSSVVYERVKEAFPEFMNMLEEWGVIYTRVLPEENDETSPIGRGWKSTFGTNEKSVAEQKAKALGVSLEWLPNGDCKSVTGVLSAVRDYNGKKQFFNSVVAAFTGWKDRRNEEGMAVRFGNGGVMDAHVISGILDIMNEVCSDMKWQTGDLMMIDNVQTMHARRPFTPPRRILASLYR